MSIFGSGNYLVVAPTFAVGTANAGGFGAGDVTVNGAAGGLTDSFSVFEVIDGSAVLDGSGGSAVDLTVEMPGTPPTGGFAGTISVAGNDGIGTLLIEQGARLTSQNNVYTDPTTGVTEGGYQNINIGVANFAGANGMVTVDGAGSFLAAYGTAPTIHVGQRGSGTLNVFDGGEVGSLVLEVGSEVSGFGGISSGVGSLTIDGVGSSVTLADTFGQFGASPDGNGGSNDNSDGGAVFNLGVDTGLGNAVVRNGGSLSLLTTAGVTSGARANIGRDDGDGELTIESGGTVTLTNSNDPDNLAIMSVGADGGEGILEVSDAGSRLDIEGALLVGVDDGIGDLLVNGGGVVNLTAPSVGANASLLVGAYGGDGFVELAGPTVEVNVAGSVRLGIGAGADASVDVLYGARLVSTNNAAIDPVTGNTSGGYYNINIGNDDGVGDIFVVGDDSFVGAYGTAARITVGRNGGEGFLNLQDGGDASTLSLVVGRQSGTGVVNVDGAGSTLSINDANGVYGSYNGNNYSGNAGGLQVGRQGSAEGTVNITGGGVVNIFNTEGVTDNPYAQLGRDAGSAGLILVSGADSQLNITQNGGASNNSADLNIGRNGQGTLTIESGGEVNVSGVNAAVTLGLERSGGPVDGSENLLEIRSGGVLNVNSDGEGAVIAGDAAGSLGTVIVDGPASELNIVASVANPTGLQLLTIGEYGDASLEVTNGGSVVIDARDGGPAGITIGRGNENDAIVATATIEGSGSSVTITAAGSGTGAFDGGRIGVGIEDNASGTLRILDGASVDINDQNSGTSVADQIGSTGLIEVSGAGSFFDAGHTLAVSFDLDDLATMAVGDLEGGDGTVLVENGGTLEASEIIVGTEGTIDFDGSITGDIELHGRFELAGNGAGSVNLNGGIQTEATATIAIDITNYSGGVGDSMTLTGLGDFDDGVLELNVANAMSVGNGVTYTIATSTVGIIATTTIVTDQSTGREFVQSQVGNTLVLTALQAHSGVTPGDDAFLGSNFANTIDLRSGNDAYFALGGNDLVNGGGGNDSLDLGGGMDTAFGEGGNDLILGGGASDNISGGAGSDDLYGDGGADTIDGDSGADTIFGGTGNDTLFGGNASDTIDGGTGDDIINGEGFTDTLNGGDGDDTITGGGSADTIDGGADDDTLFGNNAGDFIDGGTGNDTLNGGRDNDELHGGDGDDLILGSTGDDKLYGESGADTFEFRANHGVDRIFDFEDGTDLIEFNINSVNDIGDLTFNNVFAGVDIDYGTGTIRVLGLTDTDFSIADFVFS